MQFVLMLSGHPLVKQIIILLLTIVTSLLEKGVDMELPLLEITTRTKWYQAQWWAWEPCYTEASSWNSAEGKSLWLLVALNHILLISVTASTQMYRSQKTLKEDAFLPDKKGDRGYVLRGGPTFPIRLGPLQSPQVLIRAFALQLWSCTQTEKITSHIRHNLDALRVLLDLKISNRNETK